MCEASLYRTLKYSFNHTLNNNTVPIKKNTLEDNIADIEYNTPFPFLFEAKKNHFYLN